MLKEWHNAIISDGCHSLINISNESILPPSSSIEKPMGDLKITFLFIFYLMKLIIELNRISKTYFRITWDKRLTNRL